MYEAPYDWISFSTVEQQPYIININTIQKRKKMLRERYR